MLVPYEELTTKDPTATFKELHDEIESIISELGGSVVPKLNWSSPRVGITMLLPLN